MSEWHYFAMAAIVRLRRNDCPCILGQWVGHDWLSMSIVGADRNRFFLATALAIRYERRIALVIAGASLLLFLGIVPFVRVPLAQMPGFIPSYEAALFFIDLLTALLLFDQCARLGLTSILVLASGYLFDALIIIPHALSFPGAFTPTGLLGAKEQTTAWLYVFWHGGFPLFVIGYVLLRRMEASKLASALARQPVWTISASIIAVVVLTAALTLLLTWGHDCCLLSCRAAIIHCWFGRAPAPSCGC